VPLKHFQQSGQNHYLTFSCYHRQPKLGTPAPRDLFISALETVRQQYELFV
jgi:putative transposase